MAQADSYTISRYHDWKVFGTGTWSGSNVPGVICQKKVLFAFLYSAARLASVPFPRFVWVVRHELGEIGARQHYHWLLGGRGWHPTVSQMFVLNQLWDDLPRAGFSRNHIFNPSLNGADYVAKCLELGGKVGTVGGDFYESGKFADASTVTFSNSFLRSVGGRRIVVEKYGRLTT